MGRIFYMSRCFGNSRVISVFHDIKWGPIFYMSRRFGNSRVISVFHDIKWGVYFICQDVLEILE